jgi:hypothetical protein
MKSASEASIAASASASDTPGAGTTITPKVVSSIVVPS